MADTEPKMTLEELDETLEELKALGLVVEWPSREIRFFAPSAGSRVASPDRPDTPEEIEAFKNS